MSALPIEPDHPLLKLEQCLREQIAGIEVGMERTKGHKPDVSTEQSMIENNRAIRRRLQGRHAAVLAAIDRHHAGTYGICTKCDEAIPLARLDAVPEASRCIGCIH